MSQKYQELLDFIKSKSPKSIAILMHDSPDPDAMGSAIGLQWLIQKLFEIESSIFHGGEISHPENRAMVNILNFKFLPNKAYKPDIFDLTICVDGTYKNCEGIDKKNVDIIIDHHNIDVSDDIKVVHKNYGACATIITELIYESDVEFSNDEDALVASALMFGIMNDTNDLVSDNTTENDVQNYFYLSKSAEKGVISNIKNYPLPAYIFELETHAGSKENFIETDATFVCFLGHISEAKRDALPYLSDKFMRKEGISTTIITAIVGDNLEASVRSTNFSLVLDNFLEKVFGEQYSGSKKGSGGAKVPLGFFSMHNEDGEIRAKIIELVKEKIFSKVKREISKD